MSINLATFWNHNKNTINSVLNVLETLLPMFAHNEQQAAALSTAVSGVKSAVDDLHTVVQTAGENDLGAGIKGSDVIKAVIVAEIPAIAAAVAQRLMPHVDAPQEVDDTARVSPPPQQEPMQGVLPEPLAQAMSEPPTDHTIVGQPGLQQQ